MKRLGCLVLAVAALLAGYFAFHFYTLWTKPSTGFSGDSKSLYIYPDDNLSSVYFRMEEDSIVKSLPDFEKIAKLMSFDATSLHTGHYLIGKNASYRSIINLLKSGNESPIRLTYTNIRLLSEFTDLLGEKLLEGPEAFDVAITDIGSSRDLNPENYITMFLPDTYEVYWSSPAEKIINRLAKETDTFWEKEGRTEQAKKIGLTKEQVYTLASIVEKESNDAQEKPLIASLYYNRLQVGMPLQADPTVVYANGDFTIRRVLNKHLEYDSPYNTYKYKGLPIGPICMPMKSSIDAVLDHPDTDYLYMCLKPSESGGHLFSSSDKEHIKNAKKYHQWLDSRGIK